jgi:hypothetical protein
MEHGHGLFSRLVYHICLEGHSFHDIIGETPGRVLGEAVRPVLVLSGWLLRHQYDDCRCLHCDERIDKHLLLLAVMT